MPAAAAAIVAATIGSFLNLVLPKLYDAVDIDLREDVVSIMSDIQLIHASFEDFLKSPVPLTKVQEVWLKQVILLAYEIEDTTGCFLCNFMPRDQQSAAAGFLSRASSFAMKKLPLSIQMARKIRQLKEKSKNLKDGYEFCKGAVTLPTAPAQKEDGGANAHVTGENKEEELLQLVLPTSSESQKLKVISVAGYSALGNTLLVDRVLNNKQVQNQFPRRQSTIINAKDMEVGLVINEITAQLNLNQNGGSTFSNAVEEHQESGSTPTKDIQVKASEEHQKTGNTAIKDIKGKAVEEHHKSENTSSPAQSSTSSQKDERCLSSILPVPKYST